jgi:hypothetical protein
MNIIILLIIPYLPAAGLHRHQGPTVTTLRVAMAVFNH